MEKGRGRRAGERLSYVSNLSTRRWIFHRIDGTGPNLLTGRPIRVTEKCSQLVVFRFIRYPLVSWGGGGEMMGRCRTKTVRRCVAPYRCPASKRNDVSVYHVASFRRYVFIRRQIRWCSRTSSWLDPQSCRSRLTRGFFLADRMFVSNRSWLHTYKKGFPVLLMARNFWELYQL